MIEQKWGVVCSAFLLAGLPVLAAPPGSACEFTDPSVYGGPLVVQRGDDFDVELPQNFAYLDERVTETLGIADADGNPLDIQVERLGDEYPMGRSRQGYLYVPTEPVPAGSTAAGL